MKKITTMEKLICEQEPQYGATLKFGEKVICVGTEWDNFYCEVYEFIDDLDEFDELEARLSLIDYKDGFDDNGHAVAWGLSK
jgi:hypothetical protein